jgi:hypothetical protein
VDWLLPPPPQALIAKTAKAASAKSIRLTFLLFPQNTAMINAA